MDPNLEGHVTVIIGGVSGIGLAMAERSRVAVLFATASFFKKCSSRIHPIHTSATVLRPLA